MYVDMEKIKSLCKYVLPCHATNAADIRVATIFDMRALIMSFNMWKIVGNLYNFPFCIVRLLKISFVRYYHDFILMIFNCNLGININFRIHTTISVHGIILSHCMYECMYMQLTFLPSIHPYSMKLKLNFV